MLRHAKASASPSAVPSNPIAATSRAVQSTQAVPASAHRTGSASVTAAPVQMQPDDDKIGGRLSWLSNAAGLASAGFGLGKGAMPGILSGKFGAMGHAIGAAQKGREGDTTGMGLKGLSAFGSLAGMMAPRIGMAMQAPEHIRDIASGDNKRIMGGLTGMASLHPIGALTMAAHMHPKTVAAAKAQGPGFLDGTKTGGPFGSYVDLTDPFGGHGF